MGMNARTYLVTLIIAAGVFALGIPSAQAATGGEQPPAGVVSSTPASNTPHLKATADNPVQQIRQLVQCGNTMYAVGSFDTIVRGSTTYTRHNAFSFSALAPYTVSSWAPNVNGKVNTIAFANGDCSHAYIGGSFTSVNAAAVKNIAEVDTATGNVVTAFASNASGQVETIVAPGNHLLVGGYFTGINGDTTDRFMASLSPVTGKSDGFLHLNISGHYVYPGVVANGTRVYNQQLSHGGTLDLVEGVFTSVGGKPRQQMFMLDVGGASATVTGWTSPEFDGSSSAYPYQCEVRFPFYIRAAAWSPDDQTVYIATTGYHPNLQSTSSVYPPSHPWTGLCDVAAAFPATQTSVLHKWVNYTGCDSLYSVAADAFGVYAGGHERWTMNTYGCDGGHTTGYPAPGMEGLDPANGKSYITPDGSAGYYSRARGQGADDMLITSAGLWIASDNAFGSQMCGGAQNLSGICFLPYS
jgi:hypothetical protein